MKKRSMIVFAVILCLLLGACGKTQKMHSESSTILNQADSSSETSSEIPVTVSATISETMEEQKYLDMLAPALEELGEIEEAQILSIDAEKDIPSTDSQYRAIHFVVGDRQLQARVLITDGKEKLSTISKEDDALHYYYYPNAQQVSELVKITLYDYETEEPINLEKQSKEFESKSSEQFLSIVESYPFVEFYQDDSDEDMYNVIINLDTTSIDSESIDTKAIAMMWYYQLQMFLTDICDSEKLESFPCETIGIYIEVNDERVGVMSMFTAPEYNLFGTTNPIITNEQYRQAFNDVYDEYMMDTLDSSNFS